MEKSKLFNKFNIALITLFLVSFLAIMLIPTVNASSEVIELKCESEVTDYYNKKSIKNILPNYRYMVERREKSIFKTFKFDEIEYAKNLYKFLDYSKEQIDGLSFEKLMYITKVNAATIQSMNFIFDENEGLEPITNENVKLALASADANLGGSNNDVVGDARTKNVIRASIEVYQDPTYDYYKRKRETYTKDNGKQATRDVRTEFYEYGFKCILKYSWDARNVANPIYSLTDQMYLHYSSDVKTEPNTKKYKKEEDSNWHNLEENKWKMRGSYTYYDGSSTVTVNSSPAFYVSNSDSSITRPYLNQNIKMSSRFNGQTLQLETVLRKHKIEPYDSGSNDFNLNAVYVHHRILFDNNMKVNFSVSEKGPNAGIAFELKDKAEAYVMGHMTIDCQPVAEMEALRVYNY